MLDPLAALVISMGFGGLFLSTSVHKIREFSQFTVVLADYRLLPDVLVKPAAYAVVGIELVITLCWFSVLWTHFLVVPSAVLSTTLLTLYGFAVAINLARGRVHISCGCGVAGTGDTDQPLSSGILVRNSVMALFALTCLLPIVARNLTWFDGVAAVTALLCQVPTLPGPVAPVIVAARDLPRAVMT